LDGPSGDDLDKEHAGCKDEGNKRIRKADKLYFACPFLKRDPIKHRQCYRHQLTKISYVKQHIKRSHRQPICCPICMEIFVDEENRDRHIRDQSCQRRPALDFDGASPTQLAQLGKRSDQKKPEVAQWFDIFELLFPGQPRPKSAYIDPELSEDLMDFNSFFLERGPKTLTEVIASHAVVDPEILQGIVSEGIRSVFQEWLSNRNGPPEAVGGLPETSDGSDPPVSNR
jgi:hypothetical protein